MQKGQILISRGSWALRWRESTTDATGKIIRKRCFKTLVPVLPEHRRNLKRIPKEVQALADQMLEPLNNSTAPSLRGTIGELVEEYLKTKLLKPSTLQTYKNNWTRYLKNRIGGLPVSSFKRVDAFTLWKQIHAANPHLRRATMAKLRFFVSGVFEFAKNIGLYVGENPATADLPEGLPGKKETGAYTIEEVNRLLSLLTSPLTQALVALAFASGLRKGEIAGLDWRDYECTDTGAVIHVRRSVWQTHVTIPKTESSADVVHIGPSAAEYIEAFRQSVGNPDTGYMFGYDATHPINLSSCARWQIRPVMKAAGMTWKGWHGFRRGNATFLARNMNSKGAEAAALVLRHSNVATTLSSYVKDTKQERRIMQAAKVVQIAETRKQAAAVLGAGIRNQAAVN